MRWPDILNSPQLAPAANNPCLVDSVTPWARHVWQVAAVWGRYPFARIADNPDGWKSTSWEVPKFHVQCETVEWQCVAADRINIQPLAPVWAGVLQHFGGPEVGSSTETEISAVDQCGEQILCRSPRAVETSQSPRCRFCSGSEPHAKTGSVTP